MEQNKGRSRARRIVIILLAAVMLISGGLSLHSYLEDKRAQEEYERLAELARETTAPVETETPPAPVETEPEKPYVSPIHFEELMEENPDTVGWIKVPDTNIDYPIVQGTDNDFYLNHDFYGKESVGGSIYLDFESQGDFVGRNNILYGHNMKNGSMFKDVIYYKDREIKLKAVACYYGEAEPIVRKTRFKSQESFDAFVHEMVKPCSFAEDVTYPARTLYTLVTCSYEINDARTFLFAVEVDEDGNEIGPDEDFLQKMDDLMKEKAQAAAAGTKGDQGQEN